MTRVEWIAGLSLFLACDARSPEPVSRNVKTHTEALTPLFDEIAAAIGLDFVHFNGMSGEFYFVEPMGSGVALFDFDTDGDLDLYLVQGHMLGEGKGIADYLLETTQHSPLRHHLFRNELNENGELRYTDVTIRSGIDAAGYGMGVAVGDYTNDGCPDILVLNWGPNQLWRNRCDGRFEEVIAAAGLADDSWSVAATFFDFDRDGWLDLYVVNYKSYSPAADPRCRNRLKQKEYCRPIHFESLGDRLYRNRGNGTFEDVSHTSLIGNRVGAGLGVLSSDFDGDGWPDLYVTNDQEANFLWRNRRDGTFQEVAALTGTAVDARGLPLASMGVDTGDVDGDGDVDLFMTHLVDEPNVLYGNLGNGLFEDLSHKAGLSAPSWNRTAFGARFFDYDNDGWLDLFIANGAVETLPQLRRDGDPFPLHEPNQLFRNLGSGRFAVVPAEVGGAAFRLSEVSRGVASGDIDNDGDSDLIVANNAGPVRALKNRGGSRQAWLGLQLLTGDPARAAHGARVSVDRQKARPLWRQVRIDGSFASVSDPRVLIGLGEASAVEGVRVDWEDGASQIFAAPPLGRYTVLQHEMRKPDGERAGLP